jgi:2'-5' RNA ligase
MPRLFFALTLPAEVKELLAAQRCALPGARWVPSEQAHLTLLFLGEQPVSLLPVLSGALQQLTTPAFPLTTAACGLFPSLRQPRVLWLGLADSPPLHQLQAEIVGRLRAQGIPLEERSFHPHLTLARLRETPADAVQALLHRPAVQPPVTFTVDRVTLYSSRLGPGGATHTPLAVGRLPELTFNRSEQEHP